jgi:hypothetical protein
VDILNFTDGAPDWKGSGCRGTGCRSQVLCFTRAVLLGLVLTPMLFAQVDEHQVKAFFLLNFTRYVEWPSEKFSSTTDPFAICVLGQNPFGRALEDAVRGKSVEGRSVTIHQIADLSHQRHCHVLFVNASERKRLRSSMGTIRGSGVLTVGESEEFIHAGGVINFKVEDGKVRFEINVEAAAHERLRISSKLLSLARIVKN